ncbi:hypothetical protein CLOM_g1133 [Closterium sp. NIES-68]|nr:hypothetical protein CLOM_g1133 [Closterium sp. NIES-68]GJP62077.1 hypothetical protein CLOP_g19178 [Closterium sp. NIES-67]GJP65231.1 hypothetical protein CLOP_g22143 [Closterium sp. NIES-67]
MAKPAPQKKSTAAAAPAATSAAASEAAAQKQLAADLQQKWERRNDPVEIDDSEQPKYVRKGPATGKELAENKKLYQKVANSRMTQFLLKSEELARRQQEEEIRRHSAPLHAEDKGLWKKMPLIPAPFGTGKLVRLGLAGNKEKASNVFLDFFKTFHFGLWGYQQRPYPAEKPFDIQQVVGSKFLEKRYLDFTLRGSTWYYKDRLGRTRGPCEVINLRTAWAAGIIDGNTFVWGDDMDEFAPIDAVYGLKQAIDTPDVRLATAGTAMLHRIGRGMNPLKVKKGFEGAKRSLEERQEEAVAEKEVERTVLRNHGGAWPGNQAPAHALFLWASGGELTKVLDQKPKRFPSKFISYEQRKKLAQRIPGLRPWEVLEVEQLFNFLTFRDDFWRSKLGTFATPPENSEAYDEEMMEEWGEIKDALSGAFPELTR